MPKNTENVLRAKNFVVSQGDIARCEKCPASRVFVGPKMPPPGGMWYGIFLHRFLEYGKTRGREAALRYVRSKSQRMKALLNVCERINLDQIPDDALFEVGLVLEPETRTADMAPYGSAEHSRNIYARSDMVHFNKIPEVTDFKSGERSYDPATSIQLLTGAAAVGALHDADEVKVTVTNVIKTGELRPHSHIHKRKTLNAHWKRMRRTLMIIQETRAEFAEDGAEVEFVPGEHCKDCRAEVACLYKRVAKKQ
jgi:hypothetical protein